MEKVLQVVNQAIQWQRDVVKFADNGRKLVQYLIILKVGFIKRVKTIKMLVIDSGHYL